jgi:CMP-N,N'-diacetyllegionaminic acid synthase
MAPRILGLIPARGGSRGVPNKHIRLLGDRPLIRYTIDSAVQSARLNSIILSTDHEEIIELFRAYPEIKIPFRRPANLALDDTPTLSVIQHAIGFYEKKSIFFDYVLLLQPTAPFRQRSLIDKTIECLLTSGVESLTTIRQVPTKYNPDWCFRLDKNQRISSVSGHEKIITRRQDLQPAYYRDGQVYISSVKMLKRGFLFDRNTIGFLNEDGPDINIDTEQDWDQAEKWLANEK